MSFFTSKRERQLWLWALLVTIAIYSTAWVALPVSGFLQERGWLEGVFLLGTFLVLASIITQRIKVFAGWGELGVWLGIIAVYLMIFVRMEIPQERTHLIEYSVLAAFIYEAFRERIKNGRQVPMPALLTILITATLGLFDELIQLIIPGRVFDIRDVTFNAIAGVMAVAASILLSWVSKKSRKKPNPK